MIVRTWTATTDNEKEKSYLETVNNIVIPHLNNVKGYLGSYFLKKKAGDNLKYMVLTMWDSIEALSELTNGEPDKAFVPPEIQNTLNHFDDFAENYELIIKHDKE